MFNTLLARWRGSRSSHSWAGWALLPLPTRARAALVVVISLLLALSMMGQGGVLAGADVAGPVATADEAHRARVAAAQESEESLHGTLLLRYDDAWLEKRAAQRFFLQTESGDLVRLTIDGALLAAAGGHRLAGRAVVVSGRWLAGPGEAASAGEPGAQSNFAVTSLAPLDESAAETDGMGQADAAVQAAQTTTLRYAVLLCRFPDVATVPPTAATIAPWFAGGVDGFINYYAQASYGKLALEFETMPAWRTLTTPFALSFAYDTMADDIALECPALFAADVNLDDFDGVLFFTNANWGYSMASSSWPVTYDSSQRNMRTAWFSYFPPIGYGHNFVGHEMGHTLGEPHSNNYDGDDNPYDHVWDIMSGDPCGTGYDTPVGGGCLSQDFIVDHKLNQGWIAPARVLTLPDPAAMTINLDWLDLGGITSNYAAVEIPVGSSQYFTLEARRNQIPGFDRALRGKGVLIHEVDPVGRAEPAWQVGAFSDADSIAGAGVWLPGETYVNHTHQFQVEVLSERATGYTLRLTRGASVPAAAPALATSASANTATPGFASVVVQIANQGGTTAQGMSLVVEPIAAPQDTPLRFVSATGGTCSETEAGEPTQCTLAPIPAGATAAVTLRYAPLVSGAYRLAVRANTNNQEENLLDNGATLQFSVTALADLVVTTAPASLQYVGAPIYARYTVTNTGAAASGVTFQVAVPAPFTVSGLTTTSTAPGADCSFGAGVIPCTIDIMDPGRWLEVELKLSASSMPANGTYTTVATAALPGGAVELSTSNNAASLPICVGTCVAPATPTPTGTPPTPTPVPPTATPVPPPGTPVYLPSIRR